MPPTIIRPEISVKNKYWIDKHRYYELKHFCLQYKIWKKNYYSIDSSGMSSIFGQKSLRNNQPSDLTARQAMQKASYSERIKMVERAALGTDEYLHSYILKAVTEGLSYNYLKTKMNIPCSRDTYYDRYRRFFWLLNNDRD